MTVVRECDSHQGGVKCIRIIIVRECDSHQGGVECIRNVC